MPLEIRELVIKVSVGNDSKEGANTGGSVESSEANEAYVNLIVDKVLEILKETSER